MKNFLAEWYVLAVHPSSSVWYRKTRWDQNWPCVKYLSQGKIWVCLIYLMSFFYVIFRKVIYPSPLFVCQAGMKVAIRSERCYEKEQQTNRPIALAWALFLQLVRLIFWSFSFVRVKALSCGYMLIKCNNTTSLPYGSV